MTDHLPTSTCLRSYWMPPYMTWCHCVTSPCCSHSDWDLHFKNWHFVTLKGNKHPLFLVKRIQQWPFNYCPIPKKKINPKIILTKIQELFSGNVMSYPAVNWEVWLLLQMKASIISDRQMKLILIFDSEKLEKWGSRKLLRKLSWTILGSFSGMWW